MTHITTKLKLAGATSDVGQPPIVEQLPLRIKWIGICIIIGGALLAPSIFALTVWFPALTKGIGLFAGITGLSFVGMGTILLAVCWPNLIARVEEMRAGNYVMHWRYDRAFLLRLALQQQKRAFRHLQIWPIVSGLCWYIYWLSEFTDPVARPEGYGSIVAIPWFVGIGIGLGVFWTLTAIYRAYLFGQMTPHAVIGRGYFFFNNHCHELTRSAENYKPRLEVRNGLEFLVLHSKVHTRNGPAYREYRIPIPPDWAGEVNAFISLI